MKKIKYQGGITKLLMSNLGKMSKKRFAKLSTSELLSLVQRFDKKQVSMEVVSLSSSRDFYEQLLSILSFQRFVGIPISWTICSDGSHTDKEIAALETIFPFAKVDKIDFSDPAATRKSVKESILPYFDQLFHYAQNSPYGKKLFYYLNYKVQNPTLFLDSDILFYELSSSSFKKINIENVNGWYLPDQVWGCLDTRYMSEHQPQMYQVNAGFFLLNRELQNLENGMAFLDSVKKQYEYFTEQTVFHMLLRDNEFNPFDPRIFILDSSDQFDFSYGYDKKFIAMRHYTGPVRHKMWQRDWSWQLSLNAL